MFGLEAGLEFCGRTRGQARDVGRRRWGRDQIVWGGDKRRSLGVGRMETGGGAEVLGVLWGGVRVVGG